MRRSRSDEDQVIIELLTDPPAARERGARPSSGADPDADRVAARRGERGSDGPDDTDDDPDPRRRGRRGAIVGSAGVLAVVLASAALAYRPTEDTGPNPDATPPPAVAHGELVLASGRHRLTTTDGTSVGIRDVPELETQGGGDRFIVTGGLVVFGGDTAVYALDPAVTEHPRLLDRAYYFLAGSDAGTVWLLNGGPGRVIDARLVDARTGDVRRGPFRLRRGIPERAVGDELIVRTRDGVRLWSPDRDEYRLDLPPGFSVAAHGTTLAWCTPECRELHVTDTGQGTDRTYVFDDEQAPASDSRAAFSADGTRLAVLTGDGIVVLDTSAADGPLTVAAEIGGPAIDVAWTLDGDLLVATKDRRVERHSFKMGDAVFVPTGPERTIDRIAVLPASAAAPDASRFPTIGTLDGRAVVAYAAAADGPVLDTLCVALRRDGYFDCGARGSTVFGGIVTSDGAIAGAVSSFTRHLRVVTDDGTVLDDVPVLGAGGPLPWPTFVVSVPPGAKAAELAAIDAQGVEFGRITVPLGRSR